MRQRPASAWIRLEKHILQNKSWGGQSEGRVLILFDVEPDAARKNL